jgi:hypothetical protein
MNLIPISENCLINPSRVGCLRQVKERNEVVLYIYVDGIKYEYEYAHVCSIPEFIGKIDLAVPNNQAFAG